MQDLLPYASYVHNIILILFSSNLDLIIYIILFLMDLSFQNSFMYVVKNLF